MKNLTLKPAESLETPLSTPTTPLKKPPAHHQMCSPGAKPVTAAYHTPREAYEMGILSPPMWHGKQHKQYVTMRDLKVTSTHSEKLEIFIRDDGQRGVRALVEIKNGEFVCEFEANLLSKEDCEKAEQEYEREKKPVYILEVCT